MTDAYKIGVTVALANQVSPVLALITREFMTTDAAATKLHRTLGLIAAGALAIGAAFKLAGAALDEAKKFQTESARFASLGFGEQINQQAVQFASGMKTIGTSARENMALVSDAMAVFKDFHHAQV